MQCVILLRIGGQVVGIEGGDDGLMVYPNYDEALKSAEIHPTTTRLGYQIVELDEL